MRTRPVERIAKAESASFFERFESVDRPVVISGGVDGWPAVATWTPDYLGALIGDVSTRFKRSSNHQHPDFHQAALSAMFARETATFRDFFRAISTGPASERSQRLFTGDEHFLLQHRDGKTSIDPALAPLLRDVEIPALIPPDRLYTIWAWFSGAGVRTWLHYDNNGCHNFNAQITGRKECLLFSPEELERLYPFPIGGPNPAYNCCAVDIDVPDLATHPRFADATAESALLEPGDLLFIPVWWLHTFSHLGTFNSNVNFWWKPRRDRDNLVSRRQADIQGAPSAGHEPESVA